MPVTEAGRDVIADALVGTAYTQYDNTNAHIGVGDGTAAFAATQTDLQGASTFRKAMDGGYPTQNVNELTFRATFGTSEANFAWEEWGVFNDAAAGEMLNRKVESLGTKPDTQSWQFTVDLLIQAT